MISEIYLMSNGLVVVFENGEQVPELQGHWDTVKYKLLPRIEEQAFKPVIFDQNAIARMERERFTDRLSSESEKK